MAICRDTFTRFMNSAGYNVVRHPREGIRPLDLIGLQRGSVHQLGRIDQLVRNPNGPLPQPLEGEQATDINGASTSSMRTAIGVKLLAAVLKAQGSDLGVLAKYRSARKLKFTFTDVLIDRVQPLDISNLLRHGEPDADSPLIDQYVAGNGRLFVISRVARSNKLTVTSEGEGGGGLELDVPTIQGIVSGGVTVSTEFGNSATLSYTGSKQLVFGFECFEIGVEDGDLTMTSARAGVIALNNEGKITKGASTILEPDNLVDFSES